MFGSILLIVTMHNYTSLVNTYEEQTEIHLFSCEIRQRDYNFMPPNFREVSDAIYKKIPLQKLLKHIHHKFHDEGLTYTLIHRIYDSSSHEIEYYVPELIYIAVKKKCRPMCKMLIDKAAKNQTLRRLILWNLKAFTVLMKERDPELKRFIIDLEEKIVKTVLSEKKFNDSEKAIAMLTSASLILKKMPKEQQKDKLKKFIARYNYQILDNLDHRHHEEFTSNYVCRIVEDNCSCFPTRKRVPYRIVIETIDLNEVKKKEKSRQKQKRVKPHIDIDRDLFKQVSQTVEREFKQHIPSKFMNHNKYPYVIDQEELSKMTQLTKFARQIENDEKKQENKQKKKGLQITRKDTITKLNIPKTQSEDQNIIFRHGKFQIKDNEQLRKFQAIYIPTIPSDQRRSETGKEIKGYWLAIDKCKSRLSERKCALEESNVKIIQQDVKYEGNLEENVWGQPWESIIKKLRYASPFREYQSLRFRNVVVKGGDDLRQEIICMQLIYKMQSIVKDAGLDIFIKPYEIIVLSENSGMLEFVSNSISIDAMKKEKDMNIPEFYSEVFNTEQKFVAAKTKFVRSLAGSSILTYVLRLKDRHNGNILLDIEGNIIHIDFGFILGMSPGGINFESSPFKLTEQYVLLLGGKNSPDYNYFVDLFQQGMKAIRDRLDEICLILQIMMEDSDLDCFKDFTIESFIKRMEPKLSDQKFKSFCLGLVERSYLNSRTVHYDYFQQFQNGIAP